MEDPQAYSDTLKEKYKLKLKGVGKINNHLQCGFTRDEDGMNRNLPKGRVSWCCGSYVSHQV